MKKETKILILVSMTIVYLFSFFGNFLIIDNVTTSLIQAVSNGGFNGYSLLLICPFVLLLAGFVLIVFDNKSNVIPPIIVFLLIVGSVFLLFAQKNYCMGHDIDKTLVRLDNISFLLGVASIALGLYYLSKVFQNNVFTVKDIVEIATLVGLAMILDLSIFKIRIGANGGSISLAMIPLFIIALRKGPIKGFIACGIVYGLINALIDNYGLVYYPLDYLLAFGSIALAGLFSKIIFPKDKENPTVKGCLFLSLAVILCCVLRTLFHTISGVVLWETPFVDSLIYQLLYMGPDTAIVLLALLLLYKPLIIINKKYPACK